MPQVWAAELCHLRLSVFLSGLIPSCGWRGAGEGGRRGGYMEVVNVPADVQLSHVTTATCLVWSEIRSVVDVQLSMKREKDTWRW